MIELQINKKTLIDFIKDIRLEDKKELIYYFGNAYIDNFVSLCLNCKNIHMIADNNNNPIAIGGVEQIKCDCANIGQLWLLVTNKIKHNKINSFKYIKNKIIKYQKTFDILYNYIYKTNFKILNLLAKFGFLNTNTTNSDIKIFYYTKGEKYFDIRNYTN